MVSMKKYNDHYSVLKNESIQLLNIKPNGIYVDCTFGRGGHTIEILNKLNSDGKIIAIDRDQEAIDFFNNTIKDSRVLIVKDNFSNIKNILEKLNINKVDGILYDFGFSSPQIDNPKRGFSYQHDNLLDMRMDQEQKVSGSYILTNYKKEELIKIFKEYGEIYNSERVVNAILKYRENHDFFTTLDFVDIIKNNINKKELYEKKHPARKYFQAIRIEVNDELNSISKSLKEAINFLNVNGRIVTISFHSLEDKIVKYFFKELTTSKLPKHIPINDVMTYNIIKTNYKPSDEEIKENNRSRSARIRCIEKVR